MSLIFKNPQNSPSLIPPFSLAAVIVKTVSGIGNEPNLTELTLSHEASGLVGQYKDIIREQDYKLQTLQDSIKMSRDEVEALKSQLAEAQQTNSQLYDQNVLMKAQLAAATTSGNHQNNNNNHIDKVRKDSISQNTQISFYEAENSRLVKEVELLNEKLNEALEMTEQSLHLSEMGRLRKDQEDLMELLTDQVLQNTSFLSQTINKKQKILFFKGIQNYQISCEIN